MNRGEYFSRCKKLGVLRNLLKKPQGLVQNINVTTKDDTSVEIEAQQ